MNASYWGRGSRNGRDVDTAFGVCRMRKKFCREKVVVSIHQTECGKAIVCLEMLEVLSFMRHI